ncbi:MAG: hypothetical protein LC775_12410, partial [Acidobacteria bacterium]|nr:hypothetical protein [Acidobacteriota bacterium]
VHAFIVIGYGTANLYLPLSRTAAVRHVQKPHPPLEPWGGRWGCLCRRGFGLGDIVSSPAAVRGAALTTATVLPYSALD